MHTADSGLRQIYDAAALTTRTDALCHDMAAVVF